MNENKVRAIGYICTAVCFVSFFVSCARVHIFTNEEDKPLIKIKMNELNTQGEPSQ